MILLHSRDCRRRSWPARSLAVRPLRPRRRRGRSKTPREGSRPGRRLRTCDRASTVLADLNSTSPTCISITGSLQAWTPGRWMGARRWHGCVGLIADRDPAGFHAETCPRSAHRRAGRELAASIMSPMCDNTKWFFFMFDAHTCARAGPSSPPEWCRTLRASACHCPAGAWPSDTDRLLSTAVFDERGDRDLCTVYVPRAATCGRPSESGRHSPDARCHRKVFPVSKCTTGSLVQALVRLTPANHGDFEHVRAAVQREKARMTKECPND